MEHLQFMLVFEYKLTGKSLTSMILADSGSKYVGNVQIIVHN